MQVATFGGGCFWGVEYIFRLQKGVIEAYSGYMGGVLKDTVSYKEVCSGTTNHAEVIQVFYDEKIVSYKELLEIFFECHDPTTLNRQGPDIGTQYRSVIFYHTIEQRKEAENYVNELIEKNVYKNITTQILPCSLFYIAEDYHQKYFEKNGGANHMCHIIPNRLK